MPQKTIIILAGPTAVGKTAVGIELAKQLQTQIISADSRQCFKELTIGVAKPTEAELRQIKHFFVNSHSIFDEVNAGVFETYALHAAEEIFVRNDFAVVVGGTGLYLKALVEGMDEMPVVDEEIRKDIATNYKSFGIGFLQEQLSLKDPVFYATAEKENPHRLMRALEVILASGKSILTYRKGKKAERPFKIIKIGLEMPREHLYQRINCRVDKMIDAGLVEEVQKLLPYKTLKALQTVGYTELFPFFDGSISLSSTVSNIKTNTRRYAKRQLTWFKKDEEINWYQVNDEESPNKLAKRIAARF